VVTRSTTGFWQAQDSNDTNSSTCFTKLHSLVYCGNWCMCRRDRSCINAKGPAHSLFKQGIGSKAQRSIYIWKIVPWFENGSREMAPISTVIGVHHSDRPSVVVLLEWAKPAFWYPKEGNDQTHGLEIQNCVQTRQREPCSCLSRVAHLYTLLAVSILPHGSQSSTAPSRVSHCQSQFPRLQFTSRLD